MTTIESEKPGSTWKDGPYAGTVGMPNYRNNWIRLGYIDEEINRRDDRFVDAVAAWGNVANISLT